MAVKDLFNKIVNKAEAAEETAETPENVAEEAQGFVEGHRPPEPPKDENGNPVKPPEGMRPPFGFGKPAEDDNGTQV